MAMVVKNNMSAVRTLNTLNSNTTALQKSLQKVSSGMKINSAQDDASGYAISERMRVRIRSLDQANQNSQNDASLMKTAEGAVGNTVEILRALKEKAINAANDSNTDEDRATIQKELNQFIDQIDDNALVQFNGKYLIDGSKNNASNATKTILLNQSLKTDTALTSKLTDLKNRAGDSLGIQATDKYQISWVKNGKTEFTSGTVNEMDLQALLVTKTGGDTKATVADSTGMIASSLTTSAAPGTSDYAISADSGYESAGSVPSNADLTRSGTDADATTALYNAATSLWDAVSDFGLKNGTNEYTSDAFIAAATDMAENATSTIGTVYFEAADADGNKRPQSASVAITRDYNSTSGGTTTSSYILSITNDNVDTVYVDGTAVANNAAVPAGTALYKKVDTSTTTGPFTDAADKFGRAVYTPDKTEGVAVAAATAGVDEQLAGFTISILDQDGNVKKAANAALDQFKQYQRAENNSGDMSLNFHIGSEANVAIKVGMTDMRSQALGLKGADGERIKVTTKELANSAINVIENALTKALDQQTTIGAIEARLEYTSTNLTTSSENVQAAESTIRDADMAKEMTNYTKSNVLLQAAQAMLAQANQNSSAVLSLLQ